MYKAYVFLCNIFLFDLLFIGLSVDIYCPIFMLKDFSRIVLRSPCRKANKITEV